MKGILAAVAGDAQFWQAQQARTGGTRCIHRAHDPISIPAPVQRRLIERGGSKL
jgi:hypothetical protein